MLEHQKFQKKGNIEMHKKGMDMIVIYIIIAAIILLVFIIIMKNASTSAGNIKIPFFG